MLTGTLPRTSFNDYHRQFIIDTISFFFTDLPTTSSLLREEIAKILQAFANSIEDKNHPLFNFQNCLFKPAQYLRGLEKKDDNFTEGEIRNFIADYIEDQLEKAAKIAGTELSVLGWKSQKNTALSATPFKSVEKSLPNVMEEKHPYALPTQGRAFKAYLIPEVDFQVVKLHVEATNQSEDIDLADFPGESSDDDENDEFTTFNIFMDQLVRDPNILKKSEKKAEEFIIKYFVNKSLLSAEQKTRMTATAKKSLTFEVFFHLYNQQIISFDEINTLIPERLQKLTSPYMFPIKTHDDFIEAKKYSLSALKILSHPIYAKKLEEKVMDFNRDFKGISKEECFNLTYPPIVNLVNNNIISVSEAKIIPPHIRTLLTESRYFTLLINGKINFDNIAHLKEGEISNLLDPRMLDLIEKNVISIAKVAKLKSLQIKRLCNHNLFSLLTTANAVEEALDAKGDAIALIEYNAVIRHMMKENILTPKDINPYSIAFWSDFINLRLSFIEKKIPYIVDGMTDSIATLLEFIPLIIKRYELNEAALYEQFFMTYLRNFHHDFKTYITDSTCPQLYRVIVGMINRANQAMLTLQKNPFLFTELFAQILTLVSKTKATLEEKPTSPPSDFFQKQNTKTLILCAQFNALAELKPQQIASAAPRPIPKG